MTAVVLREQVGATVPADLLAEDNLVAALLFSAASKDGAA